MSTCKSMYKSMCNETTCEGSCIKVVCTEITCESLEGLSIEVVGRVSMSVVEGMSMEATSKNMCTNKLLVDLSSEVVEGISMEAACKTLVDLTCKIMCTETTCKVLEGFFIKVLGCVSIKTTMSKTT